MDLLDLKSATLYKKIRGDIKVSLEEFFLLCEKYSLNYSHLLSAVQAGGFFDIPQLNSKKLDPQDYLSRLITDLEGAQDLTDPCLWISASDIPLAYDFAFPAIPYFKIYMNSMTNWNYQDAKRNLFSLDDYESDRKLDSKLNRALGLFLDMKSIEIWNPFILEMTTHQIWYCIQGGLFRSAKDVFQLIESLYNYITYIEEMLLRGNKFDPRKDSNEAKRATVEFYCNEISSISNMAMFESFESTTFYSTVDNPHYIKSTDPNVTNYARQWFRKMKGMSTKVSGGSYKNRLEFLESLRRDVKILEKNFALTEYAK